MSSQAEDVKRVIPSSGSPYIDARAVIKNVMPPVDDSDVVTKSSVTTVLSGSAPSVAPVVLTTLTDSEVAISSVNAHMVALGTAINRLETALAAQKIITNP